MNIQKTTSQASFLLKLALLAGIVVAGGNLQVAYGANCSDHICLDHDEFESGLGGWSITGYTVDTAYDDPTHGYDLRVIDQAPYVQVARNGVNNYNWFDNLVYQIEFWDDPNRSYRLDFYVMDSSGRYVLFAVNDTVVSGRYLIRNGTTYYNTGMSRSLGWHTIQIYVTMAGSFLAIDNNRFDNLFVNSGLTHAAYVAVEYPWGCTGGLSCLSYWDNFKVYSQTLVGNAFGTKAVSNVKGERANVWTAVQPSNWLAIGSPVGVCTTSPPCNGGFFETGYAKGIITPTPNILQQYASWLSASGTIQDAQYGLGNLSNNTWYNFQVTYNASNNRWRAYRNGVLVFTMPYALDFSSGSLVACGAEGGDENVPLGVECGNMQYVATGGNWTYYDYTYAQTLGPYCVYKPYTFGAFGWGPC